jgi:uncharacterized protein
MSQLTEAIKKMKTNGISVSEQEFVHICKKYNISIVKAFGSVLRSDFASDSDIDLLITFKDDTDISLFDLMDLEAELSRIFNRHVDVVEPTSLTNPIRRKNILSTSELIYAA